MTTSGCEDNGGYDGSDVILVVGILMVVVVVKEVVMMVVLGTKWGYGQESKGWRECVVNFS